MIGEIIEIQFRETVPGGAVLMFEENLAVARVLKEGWVGSIDLTDVLLMLKLDGQRKV